MKLLLYLNFMFPQAIELDEQNLVTENNFEIHFIS